MGDGVASCGAECGKSSVQAHKFVLEGGANFGTQNLGKSVRLISLEIDRICSGKRSSTVVEFAFGSNGGLDPSRSDFNGNGLADGKEKR